MSASAGWDIGGGASVGWDIGGGASIGWDIGGVNTKAARVVGGHVLAVESLPFELQRDPGALVSVLRRLAADVGFTSGDRHAVTMTAELSQMFRTKRDGVRFILEAVEAAFPAAPIHVYAVDGRFLSVTDAVAAPLLVSAANWAATARVVARSVADALLVDIGTTSTDIIPIVGGEVVPDGWTDPDRLASRELVYSGAVRTPVEALTAFVPFKTGEAGVSAEGFAVTGDVHLWRGHLEPADYTVPTPDGRPATREFAGERLARAVCADREMLDQSAVSAIADALADAQIARIATAIAVVRARHPSLHTAVVTGLGAFIASRAARQAGLEVLSLASALGERAARCAPAASVALLLAESVPKGATRLSLAPCMRKPARRVATITVVKIGGGLLAHEGCLDSVLDVVAEAARDEPLLIVPGGGPFADAVRHQDERLALSVDATHWMAVLAMDQYAHLIASRLRSAVLVSDATGISVALETEKIPVLAPFAWLRREDPLPHSWQVTSDSIAAWIADEVGAQRLVLVKPPGASGAAPQAADADIVDGYFAHLRRDLAVQIVQADAIDTLRQATRS
jgi:probable H4MPT-linked C1 transfer pathway protein